MKQLYFFNPGESLSDSVMLHPITINVNFCGPTVPASAAIITVSPLDGRVSHLHQPQPQAQAQSQLVDTEGGDGDDEMKPKNEDQEEEDSALQTLGKLSQILSTQRGWISAWSKQPLPSFLCG